LITMTENVYIGSKPVINYVTAIITALQKSTTVNVMARGRAISNAVDVVEVCKRSFLKDVEIADILIGTEKVGDEGDQRNVSTIKIRLDKNS